jgi:hypothetical protein
MASTKEQNTSAVTNAGLHRFATKTGVWIGISGDDKPLAAQHDQHCRQLNKRPAQVPTHTCASSDRSHIKKTMLWLSLLPATSR